MQAPLANDASQGKINGGSGFLHLVECRQLSERCSLGLGVASWFQAGLPALERETGGGFGGGGGGSGGGGEWGGGWGVGGGGWVLHSMFVKCIAL